MPHRTHQGSRGASVVEYVFVLVFLMIAVALAYRGLASKAQGQTNVASRVLDGDGAGAGGGNLPGGGGNPPGGGGNLPAAGNGVGTAQGAVTAGGGGAAGGSGSGGGFLSRAGSTAVSFGKGVVVDGLWGTVKGTAQLGANLVMHPVDTTTGIAKGVGHAVAHPIDTVSGIGQAIKADWDKDPARAIGNGIFQVATAVVPVTKAANVAKLAKGAEEVSAVAAAAKKVTQAEKLAMNEACPGGVCRMPGQCFGAGTPVTTASGEKPIEAVAAGDVVLARDPESGETSYERVAQTFVREAEVVDLAIAARGAAEHLVVTNEHPFFVHGRGFRAVRDLAPGDEVDTASGTAKVVALASLPERQAVYNFEVEHAHTYFVGHTAAWVHNACTPPAREFLGEGNFSKAYADGNHVVKELKSEVKVGDQMVKLTDAQRKELAEYTAEFTNEAGKHFPPGIVPKMDVVGDGVLRQEKVGGLSIDDINKTGSADARIRASEQMQDHMNRLENKMGQLESADGWKVIPDRNPANFKFDKEGNVTSWFDPVAVFPPTGKP